MPSTGKVVDDRIKQLVKESVYEYLMHTVIIDPDDYIWKKCFTHAGLNAIR